MSERIEQLLEQARVQDRGYFIYQYGGPTGHQSVEKAIDLEKFAELIVKECAEVSKNYAGGSMPVSIASAIKQHFGVK